MLRRQRAIEIVPGSKPLRWRRYDVPQHLTPETSDALRFCAVEGDLELLDRSHRSTIEARVASAASYLARRARRQPPQPPTLRAGAGPTTRWPRSGHRAAPWAWTAPSGHPR